MIALLGMYPFAHLRDAYDTLWTLVRGELGDAPDALDRTIDLHDSWQRSDLLLGQTCGWPLVTHLPEAIVVGAFEPDAPFAVGGRYRSVLIGHRALSPRELMAQPGALAAVNGFESLSGWISLCHGLGGRPSDVLLTGSHVESVRAVAEGRAVLASIDALSFEFLQESERPIASAVHVVGHGPLVPSLPLITAASNAARRDELRDALGAAVSHPDAASACARLRIRGFVPFERNDYEPLLAMEPPPAH